MILSTLRPPPSYCPTLTALVVEDEPLLAYELLDELASLGHAVVGPVMVGRDVIAVVEERPIDFAVVDVDLLDGRTGMEVGRHLNARGIPYAFLTATPDCLPPGLVGAVGVISKPYDMRGLREALIYLAMLASGGSTEIGEPPRILRVNGLVREAGSARAARHGH